MHSARAFSTARSHLNLTIIFVIDHRHLPRVVLCACRRFFLLYLLKSNWNTSRRILWLPGQFQKNCSLASRYLRFHRYLRYWRKNKYRQDFKMFIPTWYRCIGSCDITSQYKCSASFVVLQAFRQLSHRFHGKGSGKMKTERRMKKLEEEAVRFVLDRQPY